MTRILAYLSAEIARTVESICALCANLDFRGTPTTADNREMTADDSDCTSVPPMPSPATDDARDRVRLYVRGLMAVRTPPLTAGALARAAKINRDTVGDFLGGRSWPQPSRLDAIERALGLDPGTLDRVRRGESLGRPGEIGQTIAERDALVVTLTADAVSDLSPTERDEVEAAARAAALRRIREIRGQ